MSGPNPEYWDGIYRRDPDYFGPMASSLARSALGPLSREVPGGRVLELGCGTGRVLCYFAQHGFEVAGCDISPVAVREANLRLAKLGGEVPPPAHARAMDGLQLLEESGPEAYDVVFSHLYLNLEVDPHRLARLFVGVRRVLGPRGWHIVSVRSTRDPWFGRGEVMAPSVFDPGGGRPPLRFFTEAQLRELSGVGFETVTLREHPEGEPEFPVVVISASFQRGD